MQPHTTTLRLLACFALAVLGAGVLTVSSGPTHLTAQEKNKPESDVLTPETLEKFLKSALLKPEKRDAGGFIVRQQKKLKNGTWTFGTVITLSSDGSRLLLSSQWSRVPGPATIPPEIAYKIMMANATIAPASIQIENGSLFLRRVIDNHDLTPDVFRPTYDEFVQAVADNVDLLYGWFWPIPNEVQRYGEQEPTARGLAVFADGKRIAVGRQSDNGGVRIYEPGKAAIELVKPKGGAWSLAVSPDSNYVYVGCNDGQILKVEVETKKTVQTFVGHKHTIWTLAVSADGKHLFSGGGLLRSEGPSDWSVHMWDTESGKEIKKFERHTDIVASVAISPSGKFLLTASDDRSLRLWEIESGKEVKQFPVSEIGANSAVFRSETQVVMCDLRNTVRIYDVETTKELKVLTGHTSSVWCVAASADGKRAMSGGADGSVRLWDLETGKQLAVFGGHLGQVSHVAFMPDGQTGVSISWDGSARVWQFPR